MTWGRKPFGLRDIKLTSIDGSTQVDLPNAQTLRFSERLTSGELRGDDVTVSVVAYTDALEWELSAGGISLQAYALMTGRNVASSGSTPNQIQSMTGAAGDVFPWFKIYGKSHADGDDDIHVLIYKAKLMQPIEGTYQDGEFLVTSCSGMAIDDGSNGLFKIIQNETAAALPTS